ncbi:Adenylate kinase 1, mitochondrial [Morella rubra]|uniref:adenylate kinase n=1 Tax=Morella rubra TaxID=262757 RepID=A0A6A1VYK0_9ROSI|nr:Adenylate kinase 1, mitochondrial [Morella rubra]
MAVLERLLRTRGSTPISSLTSTIRAFSSCSTANSGGDLKAQSLLAQKPLPLGQDPNDRNVQWVFLGCPGVGKGTYASRLSDLLSVPHIATGDLVREELSSSGPLASQLAKIVNQGKLVSDEIIIDLLSKRLEAGETRGETGFILDGFPRTIRQAEAIANEKDNVALVILADGKFLKEILERVTDIDLVINLKLREEALLAKCLGRRICSECGGNFNIACIDIKGENGSPGMYMAPLLPPPHCASKLITRSDDTEEVVKERLRIYHKVTQPLEEFYRSRGKLLEFDLPGGIPESWPKLLQALNLEHYDKQSAAA